MKPTKLPKHRKVCRYCNQDVFVTGEVKIHLEVSSGWWKTMNELADYQDWICPSPDAPEYADATGELNYWHYPYNEMEVYLNECAKV